MQTYRLGSSPAICAPGVIAWAINGYSFKRDRANMVRVVCDGWGIPEEAAHALLSKRAAYTIEGEVVVFQHGSDQALPGGYLGMKVGQP